MSSPFKIRYAAHRTAKPHDEIEGMKYAVERRNGPMSFSRTGTAATLAAAKRHAAAVGGECRVLSLRTKEVVARYIEGDEMAL